MTTKTQTKAKTAATRYDELVVEIDGTLRALSLAVQDHITDPDTKVNWAHVGDLAHTLSTLNEALGFIGGGHFRNTEVK